MQSTTENLMGKVTTTLAITNRLDEGKAEDGLIPIEQIRSVTLETVNYQLSTLNSPRSTLNSQLTPNILEFGCQLFQKQR